MFYIKLAIALALIAFFLFMGSVKCDPDGAESRAAYNLVCVRKIVMAYDCFATDAGCIEVERMVNFITGSSYLDSEGNLWKYQWTLVNHELPKENPEHVEGSAQNE